jgi:hypothetical protein
MLTSSSSCNIQELAFIGAQLNAGELLVSTRRGWTQTALPHAHRIMVSSLIAARKLPLRSICKCQFQHDRAIIALQVSRSTQRPAWDASCCRVAPPQALVMPLRSWARSCCHSGSS